MTHARRLLRLPLLLAALLCLAAGADARGAQPDAEAARQAAAAADEGAFSLEGRRAALEKLEEAARLFLSAGEAVEAARVLSRAGRLQLLIHEPRAALDSHRRALELLGGLSAGEAEVDNLNGMAAAHMALNEWVPAEEAVRRSLALSEASGYVLGRARALLTLVERQNKENHAHALETALGALRLWQTLDDRTGLARAFSLVGDCYMAQNVLPEASRHYESARQIWQQLGNAPEQAEALIMLGYVESRAAEWQRSISYLTEARALLDESAEPIKMGQIATGLGAAFNETGLPQSGLAQYAQALEYFRRAQSPRDIAYAKWALGSTHLLLGNHAEALALLREALASVPAGSIYEALNREYVGRVLIARGEHEAALAELRPALDIYARAGNRKEEAQVRALLGQVYQEQGRDARARGDYRRALAAFQTMSDRHNEAAVLYALGRLELKRGDYEAAENYLRQSVAVTENIRRAPTSSDLTAAFSATVYERYEKYVECLMRRHAAQPSRGLDARAFETSELARARSLSELLRATQTSLLPGLDPALAERERTLRHTLRVREDAKTALLARDPKDAGLAALGRELAGLEEEHRRVIEEIRARFPAFGRMTRPDAWDLRRIQEEVVSDGETVLLEYGLGAERSYVWAVTRDGFKSYELPARAEIEAAAQKVYGLLSVAPADGAEHAELNGATRELARIVLAPVAAELGRRRVVVVADGALNYIPFQMLPSPAAGDEPLVAAHEVVNAPSASILGELRQESARRRPAPKVLAAFGNPVFAADYALRREASASGDQLAAAVQPLAAGRWRQALRDIELNGDRFDPSVIRPLLYARRELANLSEVAGGASFVAADFAATRARLLGTDLSEYAILHFATHGLLDPRHPESSGLVLSTVDREGRAQEGFVGLQDVYGLRAPVELVVLSACRTALGKNVRGEGLLGLTRGFMYAGASSVVASLWKVDDEATAELMKQFYSNMLRRRMTPSAALREAQNSIRREPRWRSPYYWAAFTLQGEYNRPITHQPAPPPARTATAAAGATLLALLLAAGIWYNRRRLRRPARA